jgi:amino-acid N-acetyltransferase
VSDPDVSLEPATPTDLDRVERLLAANDLPTADIRADAPQFYVAWVDGDPVGVGGLELHGDAGLLRSVVVADPHRGRGFGTAICAALEACAEQADVETLYLLTTTATDFFGNRGYAVVDRTAVPERLRSSRQFADLCPDSATCLRKSL